MAIHSSRILKLLALNAFLLWFSWTFIQIEQTINLKKYKLEHWITSTPVMLKPSMAAFHQYIILRIMNKNPWRDTQWKWDISPQWIPQRNFIQIMAMRCSRYSKNGEKKITFLLILYFNEIRSPNKFDLFHVCLK